MGRRVIGPWLAKKAILGELKVEKPVIIDAGAHFGNVTEYYLRMFDDCMVHAFEPEPKALAKLTERFAEDDRVAVHPVALAHRRYSGKRSLYVGGQSGEMSSLLQRPGEGRRYYRHELKDKAMVKVDSIDQFMEEHHVGYVHILKLDVQGSELTVLEGATNLLTSGKLPLIYAEVMFVPMYQGGVLFTELYAFLERYGYELFDIYSMMRSLVNRRLKVADALFVSKQVVDKVLDQFPEEWLQKSMDEALGEPSR